GRTAPGPKSRRRSPAARSARPTSSSTASLSGVPIVWTRSINGSRREAGRTMAEYLVYGFAQSGNSYKPALYLELVGADWKPRFVDYFNGETRTPEYRRINVMGEVPVLEHGKLRLTQS